MSEQPDLAGLLGAGETVLLAQAGTPTEARLIRERLAAAGRTDQPLVSLGPSGRAGTGVPAEVTERDDDTALVPVRMAWLPEEHPGRMAGLMPGHDPYHPSERQQQRILAREPGRAALLVGEPATIGSLRRRWAETTD